MAALGSYKYKCKIYTLSMFTQPQNIVDRLIQIERKRTRLQSGVVYAKLVNNIGADMLNDTSIYLSDIWLERCRYDAAKNCLEEHDEKGSIKGPTLQLLVGEALPNSSNYSQV